HTPRCFPRFLPRGAAVWPMALTVTTINKLVEEIGGTLVTLAGVPRPNQTRFLKEVRDALTNWCLDVLILGDIIPGKGDRLLRRIFSNADALHKQLSELLDAFLATARFQECTPAARLSDYVCLKLEVERMRTLVARMAH